MAMQSLDRQLKLMVSVMGNLLKLVRGEVSLFTQSGNRHRYAESCSRWSYSDSSAYCTSNIKSGNETYASNSIFKQ